MMIANRKAVSAQRAEALELAGLLFDLRDVLERKAKHFDWKNPWGSRGTPCTTLIHSFDAGRSVTRLFIGEAGYRCTIWPRLYWSTTEVPALDEHIGHNAAVRAVLKAECTYAGKVLAQVDPRDGAELAWFDPGVWLGEATPERRLMRAVRMVETLQHELNDARVRVERLRNVGGE